MRTLRGKKVNAEIVDNNLRMIQRSQGLCIVRTMIYLPRRPACKEPERKMYVEGNKSGGGESSKL